MFACACLVNLEGYFYLNGIIDIFTLVRSGFEPPLVRHCVDGRFIQPVTETADNFKIVEYTKPNGNVVTLKKPKSVAELKAEGVETKTVTVQNLINQPVKVDNPPEQRTSLGKFAPGNKLSKGRKPGSKNKTTILRELMEELEDMRMTFLI